MQYKRILVPTDFSDPALQALDSAIDLAKVYSAHLYLFHVLDDDTILASGAEFGISLEHYEEKMTAEAMANLETIAQSHSGVPSTCDVRSGKPAPQIVKYAEEIEADLIVIATHGRTGLARLLMGSTTEAVVRTATCPVLSVRRNTKPLETVVQVEDDPAII